MSWKALEKPDQKPAPAEFQKSRTNRTALTYWRKCMGALRNDKDGEEGATCSGVFDDWLGCKTKNTV
jgi:hypothetical protein